MRLRKLFDLQTALLVLVMAMLVYTVIHPELNYETVFKWIYYGGAFSVPLLIISSASLEFWELFLGETRYPFPMPERVSFSDALLKNLEIGLWEEILFRLPVWMVAAANGPVLETSVFSSILFGLAHYEYGLAKIPSAFTAGLVFCGITAAYGLPASIVAHAFLDLFLTLQEVYLS